MGNKNDDIHLFILQEEYARLQAKQRLDERLSRENEKPATNSQDPSAIALKKLFEEKAALICEKDQLVKAKQVLLYRINELIEKKRIRIQQLKAEILQLKQECDTLTTTIEIPH